jgi:uncharacterized membrane protein
MTMIKHSIHFIAKIDSATALLGLIAGSLLSFIAPVQPFLIMAFALIICDLYTGTRAARKRNEVIHSKGIGRSIEKLTLYIIAILLAELFRKTFLESTGLSLIEDFPIVYIVSMTISLRELQSNFENIEVVTGTNVWSAIKDKIAQIFTINK